MSLDTPYAYTLFGNTFDVKAPTFDCVKLNDAPQKNADTKPKGRSRV